MKAIHLQKTLRGSMLSHFAHLLRVMGLAIVGSPIGINTPTSCLGFSQA
jgi:hypothetical protein